MTGNPVASAIRKMLALKLDGKTKNASGSQAVAGSGPMNPQNWVDPITGEPRPADRHAGYEPHRRTEKVTGREQTR
ncbi:hypothetical protein ACVWZR_001639 [Bradyrhizobium sp. i1.3.1]